MVRRGLCNMDVGRRVSKRSSEESAGSAELGDRNGSSGAVAGRVDVWGMELELGSIRAEEELQTRLDFERLLKDFGNRWLEATGEEQARQTGRKAEKTTLRSVATTVD
ncbi:Hypothetical predicted protein [Olea europaea subsp. europaea]|uniref:Uncharacterized protein n=1 Tax=Olea europaea subsp. europaea TaxID=158383 RepID=A0A8S0SG42_OLEEU|nr:Hypothetical predicted protein [Olea europaea subsp. europaea]